MPSKKVQRLIESFTTSIKEEVYTLEQLQEEFEEAGYDTHKYRVEYLAEQLGFEAVEFLNETNGDRIVLYEISAELHKKAAENSIKGRQQAVDNAPHQWAKKFSQNRLDHAVKAANPNQYMKNVPSDLTHKLRAGLKPDYSIYKDNEKIRATDDFKDYLKSNDPDSLPEWEKVYGKNIS
jgi:hypothetical protein